MFIGSCDHGKLHRAKWGGAQQYARFNCLYDLGNEWVILKTLALC